MIFAVFDPSPLTVCINCSFTFIYDVLLPVFSKRLIMSINTTFSIFQDGGRPPSSVFKSWKFQLLVPFGGPICVIMPNVVPIGQTVAEIWLFWICQVGGRPLSLICKSLKF